MKKPWMIFWLLLLATLLLVSPLAYLISYALSADHTGTGFASLLQQYSQAKRNPLLTALLSLLPFAIFALILWVFRRRQASESVQIGVALGGGLAILLVMLWANLTYWPNFLPDKTYPGFPHGLELVIAPLFFAPVALVFGVIAGWLIGRTK